MATEAARLLDTDQVEVQRTVGRKLAAEVATRLRTGTLGALCDALCAAALTHDPQVVLKAAGGRLTAKAGPALDQTAQVFVASCEALEASGIPQVPARCVPYLKSLRNVLVRSPASRPVVVAYLSTRDPEALLGLLAKPAKDDAALLEVLADVLAIPKLGPEAIDKSVTDLLRSVQQRHPERSLLSAHILTTIRGRVSPDRWGQITATIGQRWPQVEGL